MAISSDNSRIFGAHIRTLRKRQGLTLVEVSGRAGLAASTLSKVENGHISLTYDNLLRLADGLGVDFARLFPDPVGDGSVTGGPVGGLARLTVTRAAERPSLPAGLYGYEPLAAGMTRKIMDPTVVRVRARSLDQFGRLVSHGGEEFVYVIAGTVELHTEHYAPVRLEAGDSVYFDATMGHAYLSCSEEDATILNICAGAHGYGAILDAVRTAQNPSRSEPQSAPEAADDPVR